MTNCPSKWAWSVSRDPLLNFRAPVISLKRIFGVQIDRNDYMHVEILQYGVYSGSCDLKILGEISAIISVQDRDLVTTKD